MKGDAFYDNCFLLTAWVMLRDRKPQSPWGTSLRATLDESVGKLGVREPDAGQHNKTQRHQEQERLSRQTFQTDFPDSLDFLELLCKGGLSVFPNDNV